jgi:tetratricopeptide (TPR) repeat protein
MHQGTPGRTEDGPDPSIFRSGRGLPKVARGEVQLRLQPFLPILERLAGGTSGAAGTFRAEDFLAALPDPGAAEGLQRVARVQDLIDHGEYFKAADQVDALSLGERPPELLRLKALALARAGSADEAQSLLEGLLGCAPAGLEAHGLLARVAKDRWEKSEEGAASPLLLECIQRYEAAYALDPNHWPAINVATLSQVAGRTEAAERWGRLAQEAAAGILRQDPRDLWAHATLGEFHLLRQEDREAATHYAEAFPQTRAALLGSRASARRNARWLLKAQGRSLGTLDTLLPPPRVVVSSGHMQDTPDREPPRFPPHLMDPVRAALGAWLDATPVDYGFASGANGSDLLLLDLFAQRGIPFTVILPTDSNFFTPVSVGEAWLPLFDRVLAQAEKVHVISQGGDPLDPALLSFSLRVMLGLALWKAQNLEGCLESWAVWDPASKGGPGGTAEFLGRSRDLNIPSRYLDLRPLRRGSVSDPQPVDPSAITPLPDWLASEQRIHFFLFADLAGFSKLTEREVQAFVHHGLGLVGRLRTRHERAITVANTWGDGLFIVFKTLEAAVSFSQDLLKEWASDAWPRALLPEHAQWRISLHAGGLHHAEDPVARRPSAFGKPLVRAARMEPITPPGSAYLSLEFAALMMAADLPGYALDYAGELSLVKQAGQFPIFRLRSLA